MTTLRIDARDPLIFRDGRPNDGRSESRTLDFPAPSVLAGAVRTQLGRSEGSFNADLIKTLLEDVSFRGPLLALGEQIFAPAPADALMLELDGKLPPCGEKPRRIRALKPITDNALHSSIGSLQLVGLKAEENDRAKPFNEAPRFWAWEDMDRWLRNADTLEHKEVKALCDRGLRAIPREERIHVALGPNGTAEEGKLFAAEGLRLLRPLFKPCKSEPFDFQELSFVLDVAVNAQGLGRMPSGVRPVGGERRLARWSTEEKAILPSLPDWLIQHVSENDDLVLRVVLLGPAYVGSSLAPACLQTDGATLIAAKVDRPRTISGWDMANNLPHGQPKKTRRLAAAGSVYWVRLSGDKASRTRWVEDRWMQNIGDDPQLCRDGFGLAVIGIGEKP